MKTIVNGGKWSRIYKSVFILSMGMAAVSWGESPGLAATGKVQSDTFFENSSASPAIGLVQGAKKSLNIEAYTMNDPQFDQEIRNAVNRGVKVQIVQEPAPVGASCHPFGDSSSAASNTPDCQRMQQLVSFVNSNGGTYVPFSKDLCGQPGSRCYEHGKMAIIDGSAALISTGNFDATSLCDHAAKPTTCDRDYTMVSRDPAVISSLQTIFENDLNGKASDLGNLDSDRLTVSPDSMKPIVDFISSAKKTLQIETQYLNDATMNQAILDAANRGVEVKVMVASACSFGMPKGSAVTKWNATYTSFDDAGISTRIFDGNIKVGGVKGYLHAKAIIVDSNQAWVGSVNGSTTSLSDNREYGLFINDGNLISSLNKYVSSDFVNPQGESWQDSIVCRYDHGGN
jgi:phosphatidylserine/phosphatidylglycerophosphate/cardiolipin synthase-like enzyme